MTNSSHKGNVLIAHSDPKVCRDLTELFERAGYGVYSYTSFEQFLVEPHNDLKAVLIDTTIGRAAAFHAIEFVRQTPVGSTVPIILTTDNTNSQDIIRAMQNGATDYMIKPFTPKEIIDKVEKLSKEAGSKA